MYQINDVNIISITSNSLLLFLQRSQIHQSTNANLQGQQRQVMATAIRNRVIPQVKAVHPAPLPPLANQINRPGWKALPPKPSLKIQTASKGNVVNQSLLTENALI
jgi:hypothetical protein